MAENTSTGKPLRSSSEAHDQSDVETGRRQLLKMAGVGLAAAPLFGAMSSLATAQTPSRAGGAGRPAGAASGKIDASLSGQFRIGGDMTVNRLGYGTLRLPGPGGWGEPERRDEALAILKRLPKIGVNFVDTADAYGPFVAEDLIAEAIAPYQGFPHDGLHTATKGGFVRPNKEMDPWYELADPYYLEQCVRMSLRRLKLERIDLWQLHRVDPRRPENIQYEAIKSFLDKGLIRHAGLSEVSVKQIEAARKIFPVVTVQNRYSLIERQHEDVLNYCEANGIAFIPWFPLASGKLAQPGGPADAIAKAKGATPAQIAIAWLLKRSPVMLPIPGTSRLAHLEENVAAAGITLTDAEFQTLDRATRPS